MGNFNKKILFPLIFLCFQVINVFSLKCFVCSSANNPECSFLSSNDTTSQFLQECPANKTLCRKTIQIVQDRKDIVRINRSCGWEVYKDNSSNCYENDDDFKFDKSCQCFTDGCNSAISNYPKFTTLSIIGVLLIKMLI